MYRYLIKDIFIQRTSLSRFLIRLLFTGLCSILNFSAVFTQENSIVFSHIDVNSGLSDNYIKCIYKDSKGFIWFGTNSGLNRFDGYKFEIFLRNDSDSTGILDNDINVLTEDTQGNLWVGSGRGISVLSSMTYKFRTLNLVQSPPFNCPDVAYITAISSDPEGNVLIGTHNGLFHFNVRNNTLKHILIDEQSCLSPLNNVTAIATDHSGSFWIGTINGFIMRYNEYSGLFEKYKFFNEEGQENGAITRLFIEKNNLLWVGDQKGLHRFNINEKRLDYGFQKKFGEIFKNLQITGIDQDSDNKIWVATDGKGVFIFDSTGAELLNITNVPYAEGSLSSNGLSSLYCDKSGITWIGTSKRGVDFYKKNVRKFRVFKNLPTDNNSLNINDVDCIGEDSEGNVLIGTNGGGLNYYNMATGKFRRLIARPEKSDGLSSNIIVSLFEDSEKKIWIGTYKGGLDCFDPETGEITVFRHSDTDSTTISDDRAWGICEDSRKNLWIATLTNGLNLFDRTTGKFIRFNTQNSSLCFNYLNSLTVDEQDNLWISSANGLIFFDPIRKMSKCYYNNPDNPASLSDNHVISTFKDSRGLFWVCTNNGLNLMDRYTDYFTVFKEKDGLPSNRVLRILEDSDSSLWISTRNGISKLKISEQGINGSRSFNFTNYNLSDGLQGKEFNETAAFKTKNGELWFGGPDGLNVFNPHEIMEERAFSSLVLTGLRIDNKTIRVGEAVNNRILLEKPLFYTDNLTLKYKENSFTIDFVVLNYFYPERNKYSYNLEGFNDKWIITDGKENFATFSNIKNGKYIFRLKCTNPDGSWIDTPITLKIKVLPPFWKSWYSYVAYFILIVVVLAILRYLTLSRERIKAQYEKEFIESQHIHEIDSMKIKFFTNISHEFRTPLSLIFSPVEKLKLQWKNEPEEKYLDLITQNARRLLFMVNQLLDFRKMEVQGFGFNPSLGDIVKFIEESVSSFKDLADQKLIELNFTTRINELNILFDKDKLEKILFNLLSNAFKFTHVKGKVTVSVLPYRDGKLLSDDAGTARPSHLIIKVEDTGIGIPADKIGNLFNSFYQADASVSGDQGSGIGLSLVEEFVKLHDGEITVESEAGKGSCFTVTLPVIVTNKTLKRDLGQENESGDYHPKPSLLNDIQSNPILKERPTLIIADDNDDLRFYLKDNFQNQYNVFEASDGDKALAIIQKLIPDLIISDITMPGLNGTELCKSVKSDNRTCHIPIILLTAHSNLEDQLKYLENGADDCIVKPFSFQMLEAKINNLINIRRNLKNVFRNSLKIEPGEITVTSLDAQFIQKALELVEINMANTEYTVEELSRDMGMSRTLLYKKIISLTGKPPLEFIRTLRLKRAAQLLQKSQFHVSEIAFKVGFNDPKYFRKHFKNEYGVIPSKYAEEFKSKLQ